MSRSFQEEFWAGEFGDNYIDRNRGQELVVRKTVMFADILRHMQRIESICELGSNIGLNLAALHTLLPNAELTGVEINQKAAAILAQMPYVKAKNCSLYSMYPPECQYDFVFTCGVLIHQSPELLPDAYRTLYASSKRYIAVIEYYNPTPVEVEYRGHHSVLFKRDFAGELMDQYPDLKLLKYGFLYQRDTYFPGGDSTWFLMEKTGKAESGSDPDHG